MQVAPLYRDPVTGYLREAQSGDTLNTATQAVFNEYITLFVNTDVNTCCAIANYTAISLSSVTLPLNILRTVPIVDCITLESGSESDNVLVACTHGKLYNTPSNIIYTNSDTLYLGHDGKITTTPPSLVNGDRWSVIIGRLVNANQFIFDPQTPIDLTASSGGYIGNIPSTTGNPDTFLHTDGTTLDWRKVKVSDLAPASAITSFSCSNSILEVGQQINTPQFTATYNETAIAAQLIDNNNNVWQTLSNFATFNSNYNFKSNTPGTVIFTLQATLSETVSATFSLNWYYRKYYGTSSDLTNIPDLQYNSLASSYAGTFTVDALTGQYIYLAIPSVFGNSPTFTVGGFSGGFSKISTVNLTNTYGIVISYDIYRSDNVSLGSTTVTVS